MKVFGFNLSFIAPIIILIIVVVWIGFYVVGKNLLAKDMVFAYTALAAAVIMFILNVIFSMKSDNVTKVVRPHLYHYGNSIDIHSISSSENVKPSFTVFKRDEISSFLGIPDSVDAFKYDLDSRKALGIKLSEYLRINIVGMLLELFPDWSSTSIVFRNESMTSFNNDRVYAGKNTFFSIEDLIYNLKLPITPKILNFGIVNGLTFPPNTKLSGTDESIVIDTPFINIYISISLNHNFDAGNVQYKPDGSTYQYLDGKDLDKLNHYANITMTSQTKKERSGNPKLENYISWSNKLFEHIDRSFKPTQHG
ncbi:hypothetical protein [Shewanella sp.]|uniref:hypothetical protein n=1 Tax=Shewanella sp. TaxID=50422 RepID=UPI0040475B67